MSNTKQAYYSQLLHQYLDGTISKEDRFILEKRALDDPFLFEALEGFQQNDEKTQVTLQNLKSKFGGSVVRKKPKRISLFNYSIAASLVLLLGLGLWFFNDVSSSDASVTMNTTVTNQSNDEQIPFEQATPEKNITAETSTLKNHYNTPKAIISQVDNEQLSISANEEEVHVSMEEKTNTPIAATLKEEGELISNARNLLDEESKIYSAPVEVQTQEEENEALLEEEIVVAGNKNQEEVISKNETAKKQRSFPPPASRSHHVNMLDSSEYIQSLNEKVMVSPLEGITKFYSKFKGDTSDSSFEDFSKIKLEVEIEFKLTETGEPIEIKHLSGSENGCAFKAIEAIKNSGNWQTLPSNSVATIRLKMPCH